MTSRFKSFLAVVFLMAAFAGSLEAATIRSWSGQRGGDLFNAGGGALQYSALEDALLAAGHTILPGIPFGSLSGANLAGVDVFFAGTNSHLLTGPEAAAINAYVASGGSVIVEANSAADEQAAGNSLLSALGLGNPYNGAVGGVNSANGGLFANVNTGTLVGPFGDLRGLTFGTSLSADITPGAGLVVGTNQNIRSLVEFMPFDQGGWVLAAGDPYGFNLFVDPGGSLHNPRNAAAYLNFIAVHEQVPEPATLFLLGWGLAGAAVWGRRKKP